MANRIITNLILQADKHHIPKGKIRNKEKLLPEEIRQLITNRNQIRADNPLDDRLEEINKDISDRIKRHKTELWKDFLDEQWDHRQNTHFMENNQQLIKQKNATDTQQYITVQQ